MKDSALDILRRKRENFSNEKMKDKPNTNESHPSNQSSEEPYMSKDIMTAAELVDMNINKIPSLVDPILPKTGLIALIGTSDIGKSSLLLKLCCDVVFSHEFLGFPLSPAHRKTIFVSTEDDDSSIAYRLNNVRNFDREKLKNMRFIFNSEKLLEKLDRLLDEQRADLIVIDTFSDIFDGEMNQINKVRSFMNDFDLLARKYQCLIVFNHHTGKTAEERPPSKNNSIGSAGFEGKARVVIELRQDYEDADKRHFCIVKGNYLGAEYKRESFELEFTREYGFKSTGNRRYFEDLVKPPVKKQPESMEREKAMVFELLKAGNSFIKTKDIMIDRGFKISKYMVEKWNKELPD